MTWVAAQIVACDPDLSDPQQCADCGFDSVIKFPLRLISANGVGDFGTYRVCARCVDEEAQ